jgi:hypothetical protein
MTKNPNMNPYLTRKYPWLQHRTVRHVGHALGNVFDRGWRDLSASE